MRRTGSTVAANNVNNANGGDAKLDGNQQQQLQPGLAIAGSGVGPRGNVNARAPTLRTANSGTTSSSGFGSGVVDSVPGVRGDRVRGPSFQRRVPSEKVSHIYLFCLDILYVLLMVLLYF